MPPPDRTSYPGGPAYLTWDSMALEIAEDWEATSELSETPINTNLRGEVGQREDDLFFRIRCTPVGIWGNLAKLFPSQTQKVGDLIFGGTDKPLVIQTADGRSITFAAAAITVEPPIRFSAGAQLFGQMEFLCIRKDETAPTDAAAMLTEASSAYTAPALDEDDITLQAYTIALGDSPSGAFAQIETEDGLLFTPAKETTPVKPDSWGTVNHRITAINAQVEFTPLNISQALFFSTLLPVQGAGVGRGANRALLGGQLEVTGTGVTLLVPRVTCSAGSLRFSNTNGRLGQVTMKAVRKIEEGTPLALYTLGTGA